MPAFTQTLPWINPAFAAYGLPAAEQMTRWLYEDPNQNPESSRPDRWSQVGIVTFRDRVVTLGPIAQGSSAVTTVDLTGGRNCLVFTRSACMARAATFANPDSGHQLPSWKENYVGVRIKRQDGFEERELAPLGTGFGIGGTPFVLVMPDLWMGKQKREFYAYNGSPVAGDVTVTLAYRVAILDTGR